MTSDLTPRQVSVLEYVVAFQQEHRMAPTVREICAHLGLSGPAGIHRILNFLKDKGYILAEPGKKRSWRFSKENTGKGIPLVGTIAAGVPLEAIENFEEELAISPITFGCDNCFGLHINGDSMIEAHILDGDLAIIRPQRQVENGEIAAVTVEGTLPEATLKIVHRDQHSMSLVPANSAYAPLVFKGPQRKRVAIVGKLVGVVRRC
ncbi:transcriptional repressor LexA [uncultured Desulfosarcina sp.]|uniref:transcriptional repressor LexA n=1 Tax=uncultured Desulfosarcina sp. TaxID=218289 RepID=UPI0029C7D90B|nr:transcriptional repressor LexA [uncultured Desulfosarcina sp.]